MNKSNSTHLQLEILKERKAYIEKQIEFLETGEVEMGFLHYSKEENGDHVICTRKDPTGCKIAIAREDSLYDIIFHLKELMQDILDMISFLEEVGEEE